MLGLAAILLLLTLSQLATAVPPSREPGKSAPVAQPAANAELPWNGLTAAERKSLAPLERDWIYLPTEQRRLWLEMAQRLPTMNADRQQRIQARMAEWARMTPAERGQARLRYIQSQRTGTEDPEKRWDDYKALTNEQKKQFAARAAPSPASAPGQKLRSGNVAAAERANADATVTKSNLVPNPNFSAQPQSITSTMMKAGPGASTTTVTKRATPPSHQQTGLPKIAASPGFVDKSTLLPKRGPQGAAVAPITDDHSEDATPVPRP